MNATNRTIAAASARDAGGAEYIQRHPLSDLDGLAEVIHCYPGEEICVEERDASYWYRITSGSAWRLAPRASGQHQVLDLLGRGDHFGFHVLGDREVVIEAAEDGATVMRYPRWCVEFLAEVEPATRSALRALARRAASRVQLTSRLARRVARDAPKISICFGEAERAGVESAGGAVASRIHAPSVAGVIGLRGSAHRDI